MIDVDIENRHPSTQHMIMMLRPNPNLQGTQKDIAVKVWNLAVGLTSNLKDGPELTAGLRKLLEAKDCFVRSSLNLTKVDYKDR